MYRTLIFLLGFAIASNALADDAALLKQILAKPTQELAKQLSNADLRAKAIEALPQIEVAARTQQLLAEIEEIGGKFEVTPGGPDWLREAVGDEAMTVFDAPVSIDLYNGNNPLKGKGGRNEIVNDVWLAKLAGLTTLTKLDIANCDVHGPGLEHVGGLTKLEDLNLTLTPVSDDGLARLANLTELRTLGLASTQCTGEGFQHLSGLKKLENVNFHFTPLNDAGLEAISKVGVSGRLWFAHTHFTDAGAKHLARLTELKICGIGGKDEGASGAAVASLVGLAKLEQLHLLDNQASPEGVANAAKIPGLRIFDISYGPTVGDESMDAIAGIPKLEELKMGSVVITDAGLLKLAKAPKLKKLSLAGAKHVTEAGIEALRKARPDLEIEFK